MKTSFVILSAALLAAATTADAQGRGRGKGNSNNVPNGHRPPAGMCRIWINGVPPGRQPAPTDCQTAVRNQPPNSQIIWGDNTRGRNADDDRRARNRDYDRDRNRDYDRDRDNDRNRDNRDNSSLRRDSHGHTYDATCIDNDRNGWCDYHPEMRSGAHVGDYPNGNSNGYPNGGTTTPVDRGQYPSTMPAMTGATLIRVGVRTKDVQNWLGSGNIRSEVSDSNGDGVPEVATWYDSNGGVIQVWRDDDRDGRADSVEVYRNGQRVQVVR